MKEHVFTYADQIDEQTTAPAAAQIPSPESPAPRAAFGQGRLHKALMRLRSKFADSFENVDPEEFVRESRAEE
jgi:hypothetical protein